jgi:hypothetical protein
MPKEHPREKHHKHDDGPARREFHRMVARTKSILEVKYFDEERRMFPQLGLTRKQHDKFSSWRQLQQFTLLSMLGASSSLPETHVLQPLYD